MQVIFYFYYYYHYYYYCWWPGGVLVMVMVVFLFVHKYKAYNRVDQVKAEATLQAGLIHILTVYGKFECLEGCRDYTENKNKFQFNFIEIIKSK